MNKRLRSVLLAMPLLTLASCQVVSGLTGIDLDGNGGDAGAPTICEQADKHIVDCNKALSRGHINVTFASACSRPKDECLANCYLHGMCTSLLSPTKAPLSTCLSHCK